MEENFVTEIFVKRSRSLTNFRIPLSTDNRSHLILTGKNGSGKTSLLLEINKFLVQVDNGNFQSLESQKQHLERSQKTYFQLKDIPTKNDEQKEQLRQAERQVIGIENWLSEFGGVELKFLDSSPSVFQKVQKGNFLFAFFDSKRHTQLNVPSGINKVNLK